MHKLLIQFKIFARNRTLALLFIGVLSFAGSAWLSSVLKPTPNVHDEFSYLLSGDTFAHGRLTNPTPACDFAFESMHIITKPTYSSKYPPAQGLFIATGQVLTGNPLVGIWFSVSLACVAILWMLQAWLPAEWAFTGGLLAVAKLVFLGRPYGGSTAIGYWSHSFFGGAVAAIGGALLFGGMKRVLTKPTIIDSALLGLGIAILANSRPFEGLLAAIPTALVLLEFAIRKLNEKQLLRKLFLPLVLVPSVCLGFTCMYNKAVTGNALMMPYMASMQSYFSTPLFWFQDPPSAPRYPNRQFAEMDRGACWQDVFLKWKTPEGRAQLLRAKWITYFEFYVGRALMWLLLGLPLIWRNKWTMFALAAIGLEAFGAIIETHCNAHYIAPVTCLIFYLLMQCARALWHFRLRNLNVGRLVTVPVALVFTQLLFHQIGISKEIDPGSWNKARAEVITKLNEMPGKHLIFVRYGPHHSVHYEWVYNGADIEDSKVLWARELSPAQNKMVLNHYKDRQFWLLYDDTPLNSNSRARLQKLQ